jgi:hypothetical protein
MFTERDTTIADELLEHCGVSVTYARGATTATVTALIGKTEFWGEDRSSYHDRYERRDFLIKATSLAAFTEPQEGDLITDGAGEWVVQVPDGVPKPWVYSDAARTVMRIHCWQGG